MKRKGEAVSRIMNVDGGLNPRVLKWLNAVHRSGKTGRLRATTDSATRELFFQDSFIIGVRTTVDQERLGELLIRCGRITRQHFEDASIFVRHGWRLGEILAELKILDRAEIEPMVRKQAKVVSCAILDAPTLKIDFDTACELFTTLATPLSIVEVVMEATRRVKDTHGVLESLRGDKRRFRPRNGSGAWEHVSLTPEIVYLLSRFQDGETMENVLKASELDEQQAARTLLGLVCSEMVVAVDKAAPGAGLKRRDQTRGFRDEIETMFRRLEQEDPWRALDLAQDVGIQTARDAFRKAVHRYHPDRHQRLADPELREKLASICQRFTDALTCLTTALRIRRDKAHESAIPLASTWVPASSKDSQGESKGEQSPTGPSQQDESPSPEGPLKKCDISVSFCDAKGLFA